MIRKVGNKPPCWSNIRRRENPKSRIMTQSACCTRSSSKPSSLKKKKHNIFWGVHSVFLSNYIIEESRRTAYLTHLPQIKTNTFCHFLRLSAWASESTISLAFYSAVSALLRLYSINKVLSPVHLYLMELATAYSYSQVESFTLTAFQWSWLMVIAACVWLVHWCGYPPMLFHLLMLRHRQRERKMLSKWNVNKSLQECEGWLLRAHDIWLGPGGKLVIANSFPAAIFTDHDALKALLIPTASWWVCGCEREKHFHHGLSHLCLVCTLFILSTSMETAKSTVNWSY